VRPKLLFRPRTENTRVGQRANIGGHCVDSNSLHHHRYGPNIESYIFWQPLYSVYWAAQHRSTVSVGALDTNFCVKLRVLPQDFDVLDDGLGISES
jgi:hypothetical protein